MSPILESGRYTISVPTKTKTYYVGPLQDKPETISILPGDVNPPVFTLTNVDKDDEYNMSIDGQWVDEKEDGEVCLARPEVGMYKKWRIVPSGVGFMIKGGEETCWSLMSFPPQNLDDLAIKNRHTCSKCPKNCRCSKKNSCKQGGCPGCTTNSKEEPCEQQKGVYLGSTMSPPLENVSPMLLALGDVAPFDCSGCPSPCLVAQMNPA